MFKRYILGTLATVAVSMVTKFVKKKFQNKGSESATGKLPATKPDGETHSI